jgi:hypothetical protein
MSQGIWYGDFHFFFQAGAAGVESMGWDVPYQKNRLRPGTMIPFGPIDAIVLNPEWIPEKLMKHRTWL